MCQLLSYNYVKQTINDIGGTLISKTYKGNNYKLEIICEKNHTFFMRFADIKNGHWCIHCFNIRRKEILKQNNINKQRRIMDNLHKIGGKLLSDVSEYKTAQTKLLWKCKNGHEFRSSYQQVVNQKQWCPHCQKYKTQYKIRDIIREIFPNYDIIDNYRGFEWLKTYKTGKQEIDIYIPELKLAIEYDGEQHFVPTAFGGISKNRAKKNLNRQIRMDKIKLDKIKKHKKDIKYFIRFTYMEKHKINKDYVIEKIKAIGIKEQL